MEETPWTKSEFFAWNDGRRIVDLYELSNQLHCKQCSSLLDLRRTEKESRYGFASVLYVLCNCGVMNDVHTGKMQHRGDTNSPNPMYEVNVKASINLLMYGEGASRILGFLALLDIPVPPPDDPSFIRPVKEDGDSSHSQPHTIPSVLHLTSLASVVPRPTDHDTTPSLQNSSLSSCVTGSNSTFHSVPFSSDPPLSLSSGLNHDVDSNTNSGDGVDDNCDDDALPITDSQNIEVLNDNHCDNAKTNQRQRNRIKNEIANKQVVEEEEEEEEEYFAPVKIKTRAVRGRKKSSVRGSRKAIVREPLKLVVQRIPLTRAKIKREKPAIEPVVENSKEECQEENNKIDYSNTMEWSSTESEPEAEESQDRDSDASWQEAEEEEEVEEKPKRGRGRPKGSTDKVKRTRRSGPYLKQNQDTAAAKEEPVNDEDSQVPRCTTCAKSFNSVKGYNLHMKRVHNQEAKGPSIIPEGQWQLIQEEVTAELFRCPVCPSVFAEPSQFFSHSSRYHPALERDEKGKPKLYAVPLKDSVSKRRIVYENGAEVVYYQCCKCWRLFTSPYLLGEHLRVTIDGQLSCITFSHGGARIREKTVEVLFCKKEAEETSCLCSNCGKVYADHARLQAHMKHMHSEKRFSCDICSASFTLPAFLKYHLKTHDKNRTRSHVCQTCGNRFYNMNGLNRHIKDQHLSSKLFSCPICGKVFSSSNARNSHVILHTGSRSYSCSECSKTFNKRNNLVIHKRIHSGIKPYKCSVCQEAFAQKNSLNCHMKKHGLDIRQQRIELDSLILFVCAFCHMPYAREHRVVSHLEMKHWSPIEKNSEMFYKMAVTEFIKEGKSSKCYKTARYTCLHCGVLGMTRKTAGDHICITPDGHPSCVTRCLDGKKLTQQDGINLFHVRERCSLCYMCGSQFSDTVGLEHHLLSVHGQASKKLLEHKCDVCGAMFPVQSRLERHKAAKHTEGPRPKCYMCDYCGKAYPSKSTMFRHRQLKHISGEKFQCEYCPKKFYKRHQWIIHTKRHLGEAPHQCQVCGKDFSCKYNLKTHERIHTGEKPYQCHLCEAAFAQKTSLDVHMKKHR